MMRIKRIPWLMTVTLLAAYAWPAFASPQAKPLSEKQLFQKAMTDYAAGKLDDSYAAVKSAREMKKKPDKKYDELFTKVSQQLADREAGKGDEACGELNLTVCEEQLKNAKAFSSTPNVMKLESLFNTQLRETRSRYDRAVALTSSDPEQSLADLNGLVRFSAQLPQINTQIQQTRLAAINSHINNAMKFVTDKKWSEASEQYNRVLLLDSNYAAAKAGLGDIVRLRKGFQLQDEAQADFSISKYQSALTKIDAAINSCPEIAEFKSTKQKILTEGSQTLAESLDHLLAKPDDLSLTKQAYLNLQQLRGLNPNDPRIAEYLARTTEDFGANLLQRASDLEGLLDNSRLATAAVMKVKAQNLLTSVTVKPEEVKDVLTNFNRRRTSQLVFSVEDLSGTDPVFVSTVSGRLRSALEGSELPDLRIRSLDDYKKSPNEDPVVKGLTPDGKSSTVQFVVQITSHEVERKPSEKISVQSKYVSGTEMIANPEYTRLKEELDQLRKVIDDPKQKKDKDKNDRLFQQKEAELSRVDHLLPRDKLTDYSYEKITYTQHTAIELKLFLRDNLTREIIASEPISVNNNRTDEEITGVQEKDVNGTRNRALTLVSEQDALRELERSVLNEITTKTVAMLPSYTRRFLNEGESAMKNDRTDEAVENFICYWAFFRGKLPQTELEPIAEVIQRETGFDLTTEGQRFLTMLLASSSGR